MRTLDRKKELILEYKQTPRPMGIYQIKNNINGKIFIQSSMNLPGSFNGQRFQLELKGHRNKELQEDWNLHGSKAFTFDVLENLKSEEIPQNDCRDALTAMEDKWLSKLQPYNKNGYNKEKKQIVKKD